MPAMTAALTGIFRRMVMYVDARRQLPSADLLRLVNEADDAQVTAAVRDSQALEVVLIFASSYSA